MTLENYAKKHFVSELALAIRWHKAGMVSSAFVSDVRAQTEERIRQNEIDKPGKGKGGADFYRTAMSRLSPTFAKHVILSAKEGTLLYKDAYSLLGYRGDSFDKLAKLILGI